MLAVALVGCGKDTPEAALRAKMVQMQTAATERDPSAFMEGVAKDFVGNGGMDRAALHNLMRAQMLARRDIGATTGPLDIEIKGEQATVKFSVLLTGGDRSLLPDSAGAYAITSGWRIEDGQWRVYYADWKPAG